MGSEIGNAWSNAGRIVEGMDIAHERKNKLAESDIGLAEMTRQSNDAEQLRSVTAANAGAGEHDMALSLADKAYRIGNAELGAKYVQQAKDVVTRTTDTLLTGAHNGMEPDQLEQQITQLMGKNAVVPGSIQYSKDPTTGHIMVTMQDGKSGQNINPIDATAYVNSKRKSEKLGPGDILTQEPNASNPAPEHPIAAGEHGVYVPGKGVIGGSGGPASIGKQLPVLKEIAEAVLSQPGMSVPNEMTGKLTPSADYGKKAALANQLFLSNKGIDPQIAATFAVQGNPKLDTATGKEWVEYGGQQLFFKTPGNAVPAAQPDAAQSVALPIAKPAPVAAPATQPAYDQIAQILNPRNVTPYEEKLKALMELQPPRSAPQSEQIKWQAALVKLKAMNVSRQPNMKFAKGGKISRHGIC